MSRVVNEVWNEQHGLEPGPDSRVKEWAECGHWDHPREVRANCPHKPGDILWVNFGGDGSGNFGSIPPDIKLCRVYSHASTYLHHSLEWTAKFKVQILTKKGKWSKVWTQIYAGDLYRAYFDHEDNPRELKWEGTK